MFITPSNIATGSKELFLITIVAISTEFPCFYQCFVYFWTQKRNTINLKFKKKSYLDNISIIIWRNNLQTIPFWYLFHQKTLLVTSFLILVHAGLKSNLREQISIHAQLLGISLYSNGTDYIFFFWHGPSMSMMCIKWHTQLHRIFLAQNL